VSRHAIDIAAPPDDVYARIADPRQRSAWLPELETTDAPDRPVERGDRFLGVASVAGHRVVGHSEVVAASAAAGRLEERVVVGARFTTSWTVTPHRDGQGCRVTHAIDFDYPRGLLGPLERWVLGRWAGRLQRAGLQRLAAVTTTGSAPPPRSHRWPRRSTRSSQ
jgi:uncharacterized protein YndB with AHSA1/START domain